MIKPNWNVFKAKFNENPQSNFEWLCYILFCKEFGQERGIFRYKNQSAIETNPIKYKNEIIGWQAKFYEIPLSNHKEELLNTLEKAKRYYPNITKIIFYTNQEWGQNEGKKPKGLIEVEEKAKELSIKLEWRTASFFESPFVCEENKIIAEHFFTFNKSIFDLIEEQQKHTENILRSIKTAFNFKNQEFEANRNYVIQKLKNTNSQIIILSGIAGVGKTAVIKKYYNCLKNKIPFYVFKASEFNDLRNINEFFKNFDFYQFIEAHKSEQDKIIVIDSAEKLLDIENRDPFKEFLQIILENKWKIIFTTRDNYVDVLNAEFTEIYEILPENIYIQKLTDKELTEFSKKYEFDLPTDWKLLELIKTPFYLNEYLKYYKENKTLDYIKFKNKLWNQIVSKSKPLLEQCLLKIVFKKANSGQFYITTSCESSILEKLSDSGVLGYESPYGYFVTHDIYEEWALEKIIEREFLRKTSVEDFFRSIGESLPVRRSLRNWLSEKLLLNDATIKQFIEEAINSNIENFWKDEILISVLLSDYSKSFFGIFKEELLKDNQALLQKLTFLLRLACKEVDNDFFKKLGIKDLDIFFLKNIPTKPKGKGWESLIKFVFENIEKIGIENINFILPVIYDWNMKFKKGEVTRYASLIALKYYQWIIEEDIFFQKKDIENKLLQTILQGALEIKNELEGIFEEIIKRKWKYHRDPYYNLVKMILVLNLENGFAGIEVIKVLPRYVLKLADLFWTYTPKKEEFSYYSIEIEQYFGLEETTHLDYFPSSAYQTPIYWLFSISLEETIDFILEFTNKSIKHYANSGFDSSVKKVKVYFDDGTTTEQYISHCLWNIYRGTSSPVSPYLLQSIHMALEKYFLEVGKKIDSKTLERWLIYLLKKSESASISAVVASIVLAYPAKTFNVAKVLFRTKEFIIQDKTRLVSELHVLAPIGSGLTGELYQKERIESKNLKHRKWSLEELFLYFQTFRSEEASEEEAKKRQHELWNILDSYYRKLPDKNKETEEDKTWKLFLARMDRRKMKITAKQIDKKIAIQFEPELEPELKEYSEKSLADASELIKYTSLKIWANHKIKNNENYKEYTQYEENPKLALKEVKEIINELKESKSSKFYLFNHSIPAEVCSALLKFHINELSKEEREFCKDIILEFASLPLKTDYEYQIFDGVKSAISVLPILFKEFAEERNVIKTILLLTLFNSNPVGVGIEFADFPTSAVKELFTISFEDAQALLLGYLYLKPKYEVLREKIHQEKYAKSVYQVWEYEIIEKFIKEYETDLQKVINNEIAYGNLDEVENLSLYILNRAFQLIPEEVNDELNKKIAKKIINVFVPKILSDKREHRINYNVKSTFLRKYAYFVLNLPKNEIDDYLQPFIDNFNTSETIADLFEEFIYAEDILNTYDKFWTVWMSFKEKVFKLCKKDEKYGYIEKIIKSYLFATIYWKENAKEWHSLKSNNKIFFQEVSQEIGHCPSTLYALAKLLNGIGSLYINDGIVWISNILNKNISKQKLETHTIYYLESLVRKFIYLNREEIKKRKELKEKILIILDFLVEKGSIVGYMLRENII
ncbi:MAG: ATP-binding protein [Aquificae bacterium]|nr:ATP-binding protein [Aquificota bacterium]